MHHRGFEISVVEIKTSSEAIVQLSLHLGSFHLMCC